MAGREATERAGTCSRRIRLRSPSAPTAATLFVAHPDADSVTILDVASRTVAHEVLLGAAPPAVDPTTQRFDPAVEPRALALDSSGNDLYVTGERSGVLYAIDVRSAAIRAQVAVCSEPIGVLVSADDSKVFVACSQDDEVVEVDATSLAVVATVVTPRKPWALAWGADGKTLLATHLLGPGVSALATSPLALDTTWPIADGAPQPNPSAPDDGEDPTEPHGQVRGIYDVVVRPGTTELWVPHIMLGHRHAAADARLQQHRLPGGVDPRRAPATQLARLSVQANIPATTARSATSSRARARSPSRTTDKYAFVVDTDSEDVLVDRRDGGGSRRSSSGRSRGTCRRASSGSHGELYVQERNTEDIAAFHVRASARTGASPSPPTAPRSRASRPTRCRRPCASGRSSSSRPTATTCR